MCLVLGDPHENPRAEHPHAARARFERTGLFHSARKPCCIMTARWPRNTW